MLKERVRMDHGIMSVPLYSTENPISLVTMKDLFDSYISKEVR